MSTINSLQSLLETKVKVKNFKQEEVLMSPQFKISVLEIDKEKGVRIIIHPDGYDGETLDFWVKNNFLVLIK